MSKHTSLALEVGRRETVALDADGARREKIWKGKDGDKQLRLVMLQQVGAHMCNANSPRLPAQSFDPYLPITLFACRYSSRYAALRHVSISLR